MLFSFGYRSLALYTCLIYFSYAKSYVLYPMNRLSMFQQLLASCQGIMANGGSRSISSLSFRTVAASNNASDSEAVVEVGEEPTEDGLTESSSTIVGDATESAIPVTAHVVNGATNSTSSTESSS
ncbi:unnamed protein product [Rodentolepis nana]|uniref:Secreted protein n=1 Tax=Rodentolepis nana TaxID=102285 RepID=A0A0R3TY20_RODNA|nr:unnamed protein product [Rodentolepis nana]